MNEEALKLKVNPKLHFLTSQRLNQMLVDNARDLIAIHKLPDLNYEYSNRAALELLGYSQEELFAQNPLDFIHPDDLKRVMPKKNAKIKNRNWYDEFRYRKKDGTYLWFGVQGTFFRRENAETVLVSISRDITQRKLMEIRQKEIGRALKDSESCCRTLFENSATAALLVNQDLQIVKANSKMRDISGLSPGELIGRSPFDFIMPEDLAMVQENYRLRRIDPVKSPSSYKVRIINYRGEIRICILYISVIPENQWLMVSILDVTSDHQNSLKLKTSEKKAQELNERYAMLSTNSRDIILYVRQSDGKIIEANQAAVNEYGYSRDELLRMTIFDVRKKEESQLVEKQKANASKEGILFVADHLRKDGSSFAVEVSAQGAILDGENVLLSIVRNIAERVHAEEIIQHQIKAQTLLLEISKQFTNVIVEDIDKLIDSALQMLGEFYAGDRCYVFLISEDGLYMSNTHEWCAEDIRPEIANLQNLPVEGFPWWMDILRRGETICIPGVAEMPVEAAAEKELLQAQDVKSLLAVTLFDEGNLIGFLGFDSVKKHQTWTEETIHVMEHVALIISKAVQRKRVHTALKESENYYRTIFNNTGAATIIIDEDMNILKSNREWKNLLGYNAKEIEGHKWPALVDATMVDTMKEYHKMRRANPQSAPRVYMSRLIDKKNKVREGLLYVSLIPDTTKSTATFIDLTDYKRMDSALKGICDGNSSIIQATNEQDLIEGICKKIVDAGAYEMAWVGYIQDDPMRTIKPAANDGKHHRYIHKINLALNDPKQGQGPSCRAIFTKLPVVVKDLKKDESFTPWLKYALRQGFKSTMSIPLMADDEALGVISIYSNRIDSFEKEEQLMLVDMANNMTYAICALRTRNERDNSMRQLEESLHKMERILMQAVNSLGTAIEIRDPYTAGHQKKVAHLASAIAAEMGMSKTQINGIEVAGNLHDVGKIIVPSEILSKPGKINTLEWGIIKNHCQAGYDIVKDIEFPWPIGEILLQHHERMDGSGYPYGLAGDEILFESRIMAVADVVEAMSSHRPYRPALGIAAALAEIERNRGTLYDADVVDACVRLFKDKGFEI